MIDVPDSGLLIKLEILFNDSTTIHHYQDIQIFCMDGEFSFSSLFLCASSKMFQELMYYEETDQDITIFLPNYQKEFVYHTLVKLFLTKENCFSEDELSLLNVLDIYHEIDREENFNENFFNMEENDGLVYETDKISLIEEIYKTKNESKLEIESSSLYDENTISRHLKQKDDKNEFIQNKEKRFKCQDCGSMLTEKEKQEHQNVNPSHIIKPKKKNNFLCKLCNLTFNNKDLSGFRAHISSHRNSEGSFSCPLCNKYSDTWGHLTQHMYKHNSDWTKPFKCSHCDYTSINRSNVLKHEAGRHRTSESKSFQCDICDKKFNTGANLGQHKKSHSGTIYSCEFCNKPFKSNNGLKHHRRLHTGKTLPCTVCNEQFLSLNALKRHERSLHLLHSYYDKQNDTILEPTDETFTNKNDHQRKEDKQTIDKLIPESNTPILRTPGVNRIRHGKIGIIRGFSVLRNQVAKHVNTGDKNT